MTGAGTRELTKADYERLAEFRYLLRRFLAFSEEAAVAAGLTPQQHQALLAIKGWPGRNHITAGELAERLGVRHHSTVGLLDRLESKALIRRAPNRADRRQVFVRLTPGAERILADLSRAHRDELERLSPLLRQLLAHFEDGRFDP